MILRYFKVGNTQTHHLPLGSGKQLGTLNEKEIISD